MVATPPKGNLTIVFITPLFVSGSGERGLLVDYVNNIAGRDLFGIAYRSH